jgi:hypothetical protein
MLLLSALTNWSLTRPGIPEADGAAAALRAISFAAAGLGFAVLLGFFIAGVSLAAGLHKRLPRWLMWLGMLSQRRRKRIEECFGWAQEY